MPVLSTVTLKKRKKAIIEHYAGLFLGLSNTIAYAT
jgi:hypothetical protein